MFSGLHENEKSCEMDNPRHIGVGELNFSLGSVFSGHGFLALLVVGYWLLVVGCQLRGVLVTIHGSLVYSKAGNCDETALN